MKVALFIPCFVDQLFPHIAENTVKLLKYAGCEVEYPTAQRCCGQPLYNTGETQKSRKLARHFLDTFADCAIIVSPVASCAGFLKEDYPLLFENKPKELERIAAISQKLYDLSDFLVNQLQFTDFGASFPHKISYHDSCSALRGYGIKDEPRRLLQQVEGLEIVEIDNAEECCGFGGTFMAKFPSISAAMVEMKFEGIRRAETQYLVTTEASCMMNLQSYAAKSAEDISVLHITDILTNTL